MSALSIKWDRYSKGEFFILFAMLLLSADTVLCGTNESSFFVNLKYLFIAGLALVYGKKGMTRIRPNSIGLLVVLIMSVLLLLTGLMCNDLRGGYALRFLLIIAAFSYTSIKALLSPIGDHMALANNMIRLLEDNILAESLRQNAFQRRQEVDSNEMIVKKYVEAYNACLEKYWNKKPLPKEVTEV